ncbi:MAG: indolepyruvate oxidoreductase subunit beta [Oscillospiraceae bacterium]|jgi:indolepyruvate ferredoxin oxidoreductase beta subunit|nr:indolepyruvate oxidoreductase subunit beta [Oscillospiraceae bacterium]
MMNNTTSVIFAGVGGQGTLLASRIIGRVLLDGGFDVKLSEVHGMSQRGGSVVTYVKYGEKVYSPVIDKGEADYIVAFEQMEAARWLNYLKPEGKMLINTQKLPPMPVITGAAEYNADIIGKIAASGAAVKSLNALELAERAGSARAVNVVMMGALSNELGFGGEMWEAALSGCSPAKALDINRKAFKLGKEA